MNILNFLTKILLRILLVCCLFYFGLWVIYFFVAYKEVVMSMGAKTGLGGKIAYSVQGRRITLIELPSGKKKNIYVVPEEPMSGTRNLNNGRREKGF